VLSTKICLPFDYERTVEETFGGLLGTPNDDQGDDWVAKDGKSVPIPTSRDDLRYGPAYDYCVNNWCIRDEFMSLFTYDTAKEESFAKFMKCEQAADTATESCVDNPSAELKRICGSNNKACMIDGCVGGPEDAKKYVEAEEALVEQMCGKQVYFEDFNAPMDGPWGEIYSQDEYTFLQLHKGSPMISQKFNVPVFAEVVVIEFLFYEIGGWESSGSGKDFVYLKIGSAKIDLQEFGPDDKLDDFWHDIQNGISWTRKSISASGEITIGGTKDQIHKMKITIPQEYFTKGVVDFSLEVKMSTTKDNESAGVDDFRVTAYGKSCVIPEPEVVTEDRSVSIPDVLPVVCNEYVATSWGDPHLVTFNGLKYDCQGQGEFTLMKSLNDMMESKFELQARFEKFSTKTVTVTRSIAVKEEGAPTIQLNVPAAYDKQCPVSLFVDGNERTVVEGTNMDEVIVRQIGDSVVVYYPSTNLQLVVKLTKSSKYGCFMSVKVCMPTEYRPGEMIVGLLGTPDEDIANDWMDPSGKTIAIPDDARYQKAYDYCVANWCIREKAKSLFTYGTGQSFETFSKCGLAYEGSTESCVQSPPKWLLDVCSSGDKRCIFEGCAGGEEEAKVALDVEFDLNDEKGCGETVLVEDFTDATVEEWGLIETEPLSGQKFLGRFHKHSNPVEKVFDIPDFANHVTIEFLLYEFDDWGAVDRSQNRFYVKIGSSSFNLDAFEDEDGKFSPGNYKSGFKAGIKWRRQALTTATNMGYNAEHKDQVHKVILKVPKTYFEDGKLSLQFDVSLMAEIDQVSAGVDDLRITAQARECSKTKRKNAKKEGEKSASKKSATKKSKKSTTKKSKKSTTKKSKKSKKTKQLKKIRRTLDLQQGDAADISVEDLLARDPSFDPSAPVDCRIAFGYHSSKTSQSMKDILGLSKKFYYRDDDISWGWSNGPFTSSNYAYSMDLFAPSKETGEPAVLVGRMSIEYDGNEATVSIDAGDGIWLKETNAYVGHSRLPVTEAGALTIDPAQYPVAFERQAMSRTFTVEELEDEPLYVIAQATVCGVFPAPLEKPVGGGSDEAGSSSWF
jgi:hypothetical protein